MTSRKWDELPCPECVALNVVIIDTLQQIEGSCKACGKDAIFIHLYSRNRNEEQTE
jgi:hypothetical protein